MLAQLIWIIIEELLGLRKTRPKSASKCKMGALDYSNKERIEKGPITKRDKQRNEKNILSQKKLGDIFIEADNLVEQGRNNPNALMLDKSPQSMAEREIKIRDAYGLCFNEKDVKIIQEKLREQILCGTAKGESCRQVAVRIRDALADYVSVTLEQAETIARTEIMEALGYGHYIAIKNSGFRKKEWLTANDEQVRPLHREMHGKIIDTGDLWVFSDGNTLRYPGDPEGPDHLVVNCRCIEVVVPKSHPALSETEEERSHEILRREDRQMPSMERIPCIDDSCSGIIDEEGVCSVCGKPCVPGIIDENGVSEICAKPHVPDQEKIAGDAIGHKYYEFKAACLKCRLCHEAGISYPDSFPLFMQQAPQDTDILFVFETPNYNDTFMPFKGYLTVDPNTDPSGSFFWDLFINELSFDIDKHLFFTNGVLCLPRLNKNNKYEVTPRHIKYCSKWLKKTIDDFQPKIVCSIGKKALEATAMIEKRFKHNNNLGDIVAEPFQWYGRILYPLYHTGLLARKPPYGRSDDLQRNDWRKLRRLYDTILVDHGVRRNGPSASR